jgi:hypothetical protein
MLNSGGKKADSFLFILQILHFSLLETAITHATPLHQPITSLFFVIVFKVLELLFHHINSLDESLSSCNFCFDLPKVSEIIRSFIS